MNKSSQALNLQIRDDLISDWVTLDLRKLKRKIKRYKGESLAELKTKERHLRHYLWELENTIKEHLGKTTLTHALKQYAEGVTS